MILKLLKNIIHQMIGAGVGRCRIVNEQFGYGRFFNQQSDLINFTRGVIPMHVSEQSFSRPMRRGFVSRLVVKLELKQSSDYKEG